MKLELTDAQIDVVVAALGELPLKVTLETFKAIQEQVIAARKVPDNVVPLGMQLEQR